MLFNVSLFCLTRWFFRFNLGCRRFLHIFFEIVTLGLFTYESRGKFDKLCFILFSIKLKNLSTAGYDDLSKNARSNQANFFQLF